MATQSVSGDRDSASTLESGLSKLNRLTTKYEDDLQNIEKKVSKLQTKVGKLKGCSKCVSVPKVNGLDSKINDVNFKWYWSATGISANISEIDEVESKITSLLNEIESFQGQYETLKGDSKVLETLADNLDKYQKQINNALSGEMKTQALNGMIGVIFASNKYDAKSGDGISEDKVSTKLEDWDGDLKFERQDNGTYLVIKVGKDGSEVPMGYTTKEGKNAYYKEAKNKVLNDLKDKTKSSKEKTNSDSNSKSDSTSDNYVSSSEISKTIYQNSRSKWLGAGALSDGEKILVSEQMASDMKDKRHTATELKDCVYNYRTEMEGGKKVVYVEAAEVTPYGAYDIKTTARKFTAKYYLDTLKNRR